MCKPTAPADRLRARAVAVLWEYERHPVQVSQSLLIQVRRSICIITALVLVAGCGRSSGTSSRAAGASAGDAPALGCAPTLSAATPAGHGGAAPGLATLIRRSGAHRLNSLAFTEQTCVAAHASTTTAQLSASLQLRPKLLASIVETTGGRAVQARLIGPTEYVYLPQLASQDAGRPWLSISLARAGAAAGINLSELLSELSSLDPNRNLRLLAAVKSFQSLGQVTVDGTPAFEYRGTFDVARLPTSGLSGDLVAQLRAKLLALGASREIVTTYVTGSGEPVRVVASLPSTSKGEIDTVEDVTAIDPVVRVDPPPPKQTISYLEAIRRSG